jgi:hypothetical protein
VREELESVRVQRDAAASESGALRETAARYADDLAASEATGRLQEEALQALKHQVHVLTSESAAVAATAEELQVRAHVCMRERDE